MNGNCPDRCLLRLTSATFFSAATLPQSRTMEPPRESSSPPDVDGQSSSRRVSRDRESLGGSSSDGSSVPQEGPLWFEDSDPVRRRSLKDLVRVSIASDRMSMGAISGAARSSGQRPMRSPRPAIIAFNMPKERSANKAIKELVEQGALGRGRAAAMRCPGVAQIDERNNWPWLNERQVCCQTI